MATEMQRGTFGSGSSRPQQPFGKVLYQAVFRKSPAVAGLFLALANLTMGASLA